MPTATDTRLPLLCESCGYNIDSLAGPIATVDSVADAKCPECAEPLVNSLPASRFMRWSGRLSALPSFASELLRGPRYVFRHVSIEPHHAVHCQTTVLRVAACTHSAVVAVALICDLLLRVDVRSSIHPAPFFLIIGFAGLVVPALMGLLWLLTYIERRGVQLIGRTRQWRITSDVAKTVCGYASVGWLAGLPLVVLAGVCFVLGQAPTPLGVRLSMISIYLLPTAWMLSLLAFETLVYLGIRQCRFANVPQPR